jgi:hypothetical protein
MNLYSSAYIFLFYDAAHGIDVESRFWWLSQGRCLRCSRLIKRLDGIFCANFGCQPFGSRTCLACWCPTCYRMDTIVNFLVWRKRDPISGLEVVDEGDKMRHRVVARPGDSLIAPFECDNCAFFRLEYHWPTWTSAGERLLGAYIRQVNLDVFWSRAPDTVTRNMREFKNQAKIGQDLGFAVFDPIGPFDRAYDGGMRAAIGVLMKAQQPG